VDIKKETDEPLEAPFLKNEIPVGITPQEHSGSGTPRIAAFTTECLLFLPRYFDIIVFGKNTYNIPAKKKPIISQGAISFIISRNSIPNAFRYSIVLLLFQAKLAICSGYI